MILQGRVALVTAAGSGIGRAGAEILAAEGAMVMVTDLDGAAAAATAGAIRGDGWRAESGALDVTDDAAVRDVVDRLVARHGRIDILHSHAGIQVEGSLEQVDAGGMDASWQLNVRAHFVIAREVVAHMKARGSGSIIITSSSSGVLYDREMIAYATTKHAVVAMTRQMALDYGRFNIRINSLCPGWVDTPFNAPFMKQMGGRDALLDYVRDRIPLGRFATAREIAESILFLASDRSSFITGHALLVDGGECLGG